jgi:hypothetical protein
MHLQATTRAVNAVALADDVGDFFESALASAKALAQRLFSSKKKQTEVPKSAAELVTRVGNVLEQAPEPENTWRGMPADMRSEVFALIDRLSEDDPEWHAARANLRRTAKYERDALAFKKRHTLTDWMLVCIHNEDVRAYREALAHPQWNDLTSNNLALVKTLATVYRAAGATQHPGFFESARYMRPLKAKIGYPLISAILEGVIAAGHRDRFETVLGDDTKNWRLIHNAAGYTDLRIVEQRSFQLLLNEMLRALIKHDHFDWYEWLLVRTRIGKASEKVPGFRLSVKEIANNQSATRVFCDWNSGQAEMITYAAKKGRAAFVEVLYNQCTHWMPVLEDVTEALLLTAIERDSPALFPVTVIRSKFPLDEWFLKMQKLIEIDIVAYTAFNMLKAFDTAGLKWDAERVGHAMLAQTRIFHLNAAFMEKNDAMRAYINARIKMIKSGGA